MREFVAKLTSQVIVTLEGLIERRYPIRACPSVQGRNHYIRSGYNYAFVAGRSALVKPDL